MTLQIQIPHSQDAYYVLKVEAAADVKEGRQSPSEEVESWEQHG